MIFTIVATFLYFVAFITILAGYSWCSNSQKASGSHLCDARVAAGVSTGSKQKNIYLVFCSKLFTMVLVITYKDLAPTLINSMFTY